MNHISIRPVTPTDAAAVSRIYAYYVEHTHVSFEYSAPSTDVFLERIREATTEFPWLVCLQGDTVIGYVYAHKHRLRDAYQWSPESSIYLAPEVTGKGLGKILYATLFALLKLQGYHWVFAGVALPNHQSVGLHKQLGFETIGIFKHVGYKNGKWHDTCWFQRKLQTITDEPLVPRPFPSIVSDVECTQVLSQANQQLKAILETS